VFRKRRIVLEQIPRAEPAQAQRGCFTVITRDIHFRIGGSNPLERRKWKEVLQTPFKEFLVEPINLKRRILMSTHVSSEKSNLGDSGARCYFQHINSPYR
jgi:hypothetical protein